MAEEGFEEWDADFLDQVIQYEELALSSTNPTQCHPPPPPPPLGPQVPPQLAWMYSDISYSPPRELTQRVKRSSNKGFDQSSNDISHTHTALASVPFVRSSQNAKEQEMESLKRELGRVSKQLTVLEQECLVLRKERDKKEEQLKSVFSRVEAKDAENHCTMNASLEYGVHIQDQPRISLGCQNGSSSHDRVGSQINIACKAVGVQTDKSSESTHLSTARHCPSKLLGIWDLMSGAKSERNLVAKLFGACETDFCVLFGCLNLSLSGKTMVHSPGESSSHVALQNDMQSVCSAEAAKVSHLYSMLMKISNGMIKLEAFLEALVDLCGLENCTVLRDNVMIEGPSTGNSTMDVYGSEYSGIGGLYFEGTSVTSIPGHISLQRSLFNVDIDCKKEVWSHGSTESIACIDWVSLFELMRQIAMKNNEEHVKLDAVSIMNMILMRTNAYSEREKFGQMLVFQSVSQLLKKEAGLCVQKQAVHLLYLLLNCPKLMAMFCSGCKEEGESVGAAKNDSAFPGFNLILEGLVDCVACCGNGTQELKLQRNAIIMLAFLASSGKSGFEILLVHWLPKRINFLELILQILASEIDVEATESTQPPEIFKERTLLIREALILLNRLVSSPQYSTPVLQVLTKSRDVAGLTIDIANRLSQKSKWLYLSDNMSRQMGESEILELARVFKKRVFTFLGDNIS